MKSAEDVVPLLRHMEWADARIWSAILALPAGADAETAFHERLKHVHLVQRAFLQLWRDATVTAVADAEQLTELRTLVEWARPYYAEAQATLAALVPADLQRPIVPPWAHYYVPKGQTPGAASLAETVVQVAMHSTHHRGQHATLIRTLGGEPPNTDLIAWIWLGRPGAEWQAVGGGR